MTRVESAVSCYKEGYSCSQAVFSAFCEELGLDRETALKISGPFGGGMGRTAGTCGAVTGALMVLGLRYGSAEGNPEAKARTHKYAREFMGRFRELHGTLVCKDLLGCDISTHEGHAQAVESGLTKTMCAQFVREAAEILEQLL